MKINWNQNPLKTTVDLDDRDRKLILINLQRQELVEIFCSLDNWLQRKTKKNEEPTLEKVHKEIAKWSKIYGMTIDHEEVKAYEQSLQQGHGGDCTCWPMTCDKCMAEEALGIDTIKGLGKHSAHKIMSAFNQTNDIDEAIAILEQKQNYVKPDTWKHDFEKHIPRWEAEREAAIRWLKAYKEEHGF
jgi:hypothetical protein